MDFDELMEAMFARVPEDVDKREGGLIYTALAPIAAQLAEQRIYDDTVQDITMPDTAVGTDLTRLCGMFGVRRKPAGRAIRRGRFQAVSGNVPAEVPAGTRFGAEGIVYLVSSRIDAGDYELECQREGLEGNSYFGAILPLDHFTGLGSAVLSDVLLAGTEEESDDALRARFYERVNSKAFGGNVAQYREALLAIGGVGDAAVFPTPENEGGRVHCVIVTPENLPCSGVLLRIVQEAIDPPPGGQGAGIAPIGHSVTFSTVTQMPVNVAAMVVLREGYTLEFVQAAALTAIGRYLASVSFVDNVVRVARIESAILDVDGVADIAQTTLCGAAANLILPCRWDNYQVPALGTVTLTEVG